MFKKRLQTWSHTYSFWENCGGLTRLWFLPTLPCKFFCKSLPAIASSTLPPPMLLCLLTSVKFLSTGFLYNCMCALLKTTGESLRGQTVLSVHCTRIPQIKFVAVSATLLLFFDFCCFWIVAPKIGEFADSAIVFAESRTVCGIRQQITRRVYSYIELLRNWQL